MGIYVVLGVVGGLVVLWLVGYLLSAFVDSRRPREVDLPPLPQDDRLQAVQRLTLEWQQVRHHWIKDSDSDTDTRAA